MPRSTPHYGRIRFSLLTCLVLVAILCWGMALRPGAIRLTKFGEHPVLVQQGAGMVSLRYQPDYGLAINPDLKWPVLALVAFIVWKIAARRRTRSRFTAATA